MFRIFKKSVPDSFNEKNWHLVICNDRVEKQFLNSKFPIEIEICEWQDYLPSKIDNRYYDITWEAKAKNKNDPAALFIAFVHKDKFKDIAKQIKKTSKKLGRIKMRLTLDKHDDPKNKKSHPEWQCWLEVVELSLL
jgi:hypothetical protein